MEFSCYCAWTIMAMIIILVLYCFVCMLPNAAVNRHDEKWELTYDELPKLFHPTTRRPKGPTRRPPSYFGIPAHHHDEVQSGQSLTHSSDDGHDKNLTLKRTNIKIILPKNYRVTNNTTLANRESTPVNDVNVVSTPPWLQKLKDEKRRKEI